MAKVLTAKNIELNRSFKNKLEAIHAAGRILVDNGYVAEEYITSMIERDRDVSVYIGNSLAIPHGLPESEPYINESGISVIQVPNGVDFDGQTAYVVIGIAGKNNTHMDILSQIAIVCMEESNVQKIRTAHTKESILELLENLGNE